MVAVKILNESGYMICSAGVVHFPCVLFLLWWDWLFLEPTSAEGFGDFYSIEVVYMFVQRLWLKLLNFSFRIFSDPFRIPERKQEWAASLLEHTPWFLMNFSLSAFPMIPYGKLPALGWKAISYFLAFLCQHYLELWLMLTSVIICDFPPSFSTQSTEWYLQSTEIMSTVYERAGSRYYA